MVRTIKYFILILFLGGIILSTEANSKKQLVYKFSIDKEIGPSMWRITQKAINEALTIKADLIVIRLNTYGGMVDAADSIRTKILNCPIPVYVFIDNNAASAGALIAISSDRIYMRTGANIGAATVVDQQGKVVPDKYQSYMRSIMRSTAEAHGKDTLIQDNDTIIKWRRDPLIAEAMVDPRTYIKGVNDTGKVLTMTTSEAIKNGYCEGQAENIPEVLEQAGVPNYEIKEYQVTGMDSILGFLTNPILQGILIMIIVAGIYFEMQSPGISFPLIAAVTAALLYFAPLYLEGLASNWEIIIFAIGVILIIAEIFFIPGFGVAGISGIILVITGLTMALVDNYHVEPLSMSGLTTIFKALALVVVSITIAFTISIIAGSRIAKSRKLKIALYTEQLKSEGFVGVDVVQLNSLIGKEGIARTILRPSGIVEIDDNTYDAKAEISYIEAGKKIKVIRTEAGQLYVLEVK